MSMHYSPPRQWEWAALVPILAGIFALTGQESFGWWVFAGIPGALVLTTGMALLLIPGDPRVTSYMALGSTVGMLLCVLLIFFEGFGPAFTLALLYAGSFLVSGRIGLRHEPVYEGAGETYFNLRMDFKAALDETVLGYFLGSAAVPSTVEAASMCDDAAKLDALLHERGWHLNPDSFHKVPPPPERVQVRNARLYGFEYEHVSYDSQFELPAELPGAQLWMSYERNARATANVLRHRGAPRPWLICIHGYRMGLPALDFSLFSPGYLHHKLGFNLLMPTLPLHGSRKIGLRTGDYFLDGDLLDLLYAETQAIWDLRRWLLWLRSLEDKPAIGVYGVSLGGYNAGLLAQYDDALDFVVAGVPVADLASCLWRYVPPAHQRYFASRGLDEARYRDILKLVSPLARAPRMDSQHLHVFAATGDRIVAPRHAVMLSRHWKVPVTWYQGSHLSIRRESAPRQVIEEAAGRAGWRSDGYAVA